MFPKARLDSLSDGVFAFAMTLLALGLTLPQSFQPGDAPTLIAAIRALWAEFLPYLLSFLVLAAHWLGYVGGEPAVERVSAVYARWAFVRLFLTTCVPFSTDLVGRFIELAPAIWIYVGNLALIMFAAHRMNMALPERDQDHDLDHRIGVAVFMFSCAVAFGWSFVEPTSALFALLLNLFSPIVARGLRRRA